MQFSEEELKKYVDVRVHPLVLALNAFPGTHTFSSCGGHKGKKDQGGRVSSGKFQVNLYFDRTSKGWRSLELITYVVSQMEWEEEEYAAIKPWYNGSNALKRKDGTICFELEGRLSLDVFVKKLEWARIAF